jgi:hypothetical protein
MFDLPPFAALTILSLLLVSSFNSKRETVGTRRGCNWHEAGAQHLHHGLDDHSLLAVQLVCCQGAAANRHLMNTLSK